MDSPDPSTMTPAAKTRNRAAPTRFVLTLGAVGATILILGLTLSWVFYSLDIQARWFLFVGHAGDALHPDNESNVWAWFSSLMLALLAASFVVLGVAARARGLRAGIYFASAAVAVFMSGDEAARFHERFDLVGNAIGINLPSTLTWLAIGVPFAAVVGFLLVRYSRPMDRVLRGRLIVAGAVFLLGAVGFELVGAAIDITYDGIENPTAAVLYQIEVALEEGLEAAGVLIALWAVLSTLRFETRPAGLTVEYGPARP